MLAKMVERKRERKECKKVKKTKIIHPLEPLELCRRPLGVEGAVLWDGLDEQAVVFGIVFFSGESAGRDERERKEKRKRQKKDFETSYSSTFFEPCKPHQHNVELPVIAGEAVGVGLFG